MAYVFIAFVLFLTDINAKDEDNWTPLHIAISGGKTEIVEMLLDRGADINAKDEDSATPLHSAVRCRETEIFEMLLDRGADINAKDKNGWTPLHYAAQCGKTEVIQMLLDRGADINAKTKYNWTPLHSAAQDRKPEILKIFLDRGSDINAKDKDSLTPLHCAAAYDRTVIIQMLLDRGADINAKDKNNWTPLHSPTLYDRTRSRGFLSQHVIKMKIAGFYVNDENLSLIDSNSNFCNVCETEIQAMKNETVGDSYVSFYDILKKSSNQLAMFLRNESILQVLESVDFRTRFPTYGCMINKQFISGKRRKEFLESGTNVFHSNVRWLPNLCTEKILNYLSDEDIKV